MVVNLKNLNSKTPDNKSGDDLRGLSDSEQVKKLVEENLKITRDIHKMTKKINHFVLWSRIFGFLKVLLIVVPIVLGILYLPPLLENIMERYKEVLGFGSVSEMFKGDQSGNQINFEDIDIDQLPPELRKLIK